MKLTLAEVRHLLVLLFDVKIEGSYYGNREQYRQRQVRITKKLVDLEATLVGPNTRLGKSA